MPLQKERYDLVFKKKDIDTKPMRALMGILETGILKEEFSSLGGYDTSDMGKIDVYKRQSLLCEAPMSARRHSQALELFSAWASLWPCSRPSSTSPTSS